jgi:hypothetical protein
VHVHDAGLDDSDSILHIDGENLVHPLHLNNDAAFRRQRAPAQSGSGATRQERNGVFVGELHDCGNLLRVFREDHGVRLVLEERKGVAFVNEEFGFVGYNSILACNFAKFLENISAHYFLLVSSSIC